MGQFSSTSFNFLVDFKSDPEKLKKLSEDIVSLGAAGGGKESPEESRNETTEEVLEFNESRQPSLEVNAPNVNLLTTYQQGKHASLIMVFLIRISHSVRRQTNLRFAHLGCKVV